MIHDPDLSVNEGLSMQVIQQCLAHLGPTSRVPHLDKMRRHHFQHLIIETCYVLLLEGRELSGNSRTQAHGPEEMVTNTNDFGGH